MSATEDRLKQLINDHLDLGRDADFDAPFNETGVSSVDAIAFFKEVSKEFNLAFTPAEFASCPTLREVVNYIDSHSG